MKYALIFITGAFLLAGCNDDEWPQERRQRESVNVPPTAREFIRAEDRISDLERRVEKLEKRK